MAFHIVPNVCGLKWNERLVLDALCYFANSKTKECYPSQKTIAEWCDIDRKKVIEGVKGLVEKGIIETKKTNKTLIYTIKIEIKGTVRYTENGTANNAKIECCTENGTACCTENGTQTILNELDNNLRTQSVRLGQSTRKKSLTVQVEQALQEEYKKLEQEGNKIIQTTVPVRRKIIKNILQYFDNNIVWIKDYIHKALNDSYVIKQCYSCLALFSRSTIQKYLNETKPRKYSEPAPKYEQSETDKMLESMTPEERAKWIENKLKEFMEAKK